MACVRPDGTLSGSGRALLAAVQTEMTATDAAEKVGMPLHLVRSGLREMVAAGLVREDGERFGQTEKGSATVRSSGG